MRADEKAFVFICIATWLFILSLTAVVLKSLWYVT